MTYYIYLCSKQTVGQFTLVHGTKKKQKNVIQKLKHRSWYAKKKSNSETQKTRKMVTYHRRHQDSCIHAGMASKTHCMWSNACVLALLHLWTKEIIYQQNIVLCTITAISIITAGFSVKWQMVAFVMYHVLKGNNNQQHLWHHNKSYQHLAVYRHLLTTIKVSSYM